jgi:spore maturation protein SpmA
MVLNYIWIGFFVVAFVVALLRSFLFNEFFVFSDMVQSTFDMAKTSVSISIVLIGVMTLWLGIMRIGEKGGAVGILAKGFSPFFKKIFPEVPDNHPAMGAIVMNYCANMLGLDNAATPFGLKAMEELQKLNPKKDTASNAQIMFLVLNTSALTLIPVSIMAIRAAEGAANPTDIFIPILLTTFCSTLAGLIIVSIIQHINLFHWIVLLYLGGISALIALIMLYFSQLTQGQIESRSVFAGNFILFSIVIAFILLAFKRKINVYESFIDGAKEGFNVAIKIIPYLVAMLVAIGVFRASGAMDFLIQGIEMGIASLGFNTDFVPALPTGLMKPLSGSGARGLMIDAMQTYGPDSFVGRLTSTFQGSTETTFYTVAVYYGAVNIRKTRYTIGCGLFADLVAIVAGIFIAYIFFH